MAHVCSLSDGTTSVDFMTLSTGATGYGVAHEGSDFGKAPRDGGPRVMTLKIDIRGSSATDIQDKFVTLRRLLKDAREFTDRGLGRRVSLSVTPNGGINQLWYVYGGEIAQRAEPFHPRRMIGFRSGWFTLQLEVEPYALAAGTTQLASGAALYGYQQSPAYQYVHHTGATAFSANLITVTDGSFWQTTKLSTSPTTVTPQANDVLYFGGSNTFSNLFFGLRTVASGITWGNWQYWNGSAWTNFTPSTNDFKTSAELDTAVALGKIGWSSLSGWAATTVNGVNVFWVRLTVSSVSSPTAPVRINGPVRSDVFYAQAIATTAIKGDVDALAKPAFAADSSGGMGGIIAAVATGHASNYPPTFMVPCQSADVFVPSGDSSAAIATDTNATWGERVEVTLLSSFTERSQTFNGTDEYAARTGDATSAEYLTVYQSAFRMGVWFYLTSLPTKPVPLVSQWTNTSSTQSFWFGIDPTDPDGNGAPQLRLLLRDADGDKRTLNGSTSLVINRWYWAAWHWKGSGDHMEIYLDGKLEGRTHAHDAPRQLATSTTAWRIGSSVSWSTADSRDGSSTEGFFAGRIGEVVLWDDDFDSVGGAKTPTSATVDGSTVALLLKMEDNAASATLADSASTRSANTYDFTRAGASTNSSAHTTAGPFSTGAATPSSILGLRLPQLFGEEYAGRYRILLRAGFAAATITSVDDILIYGQLGTGDATLPYTGPAARFADCSAPSNGYYLLDLGTVTLPPARIYDGHRSATASSARNLLTFYIMAATSLINKVIYLDTLYLLPLDTWCGEYRTFRTTFNSSYKTPSSGSIVFDGLSPLLTVWQANSTNSSVQSLNPYAWTNSQRPVLKPGKAAWIFGIPLRGATATSSNGADYVYHNLADTLTHRLTARWRWDEFAATSS